jgi:hypothetical protein
VYGIAPEYVVDEEAYKSSVEKTGGTYYKCTSDKIVDQLVSDIQKTDKSDLDMIETVIYDKPKMIFGIMIFFLAIYFVLSRVVKK